MNRNAEPEDTAAARLRLLCRTLRDHQESYALRVLCLKTPYMTRETCKPDLARTVAVLRNLRYVDLPEGMFTDDPSCSTLKQEVQARCPDIRKMAYMGGAERDLELLSSGMLWRNLEVLELGRLKMDSTILRKVLGSLPQLRALKVTDMNTFNDELFRHSDYLPPFPALTELIFENTPNLTADGLAAYLFRSDTQDALKTLFLSTTGVHPSTLQQILAVAPKLEHLSIIESVTTSFPASSNVHALQSKSLRTFHYEITSGLSANIYANTTTSYYSYLTSSLLSGGLPNLQELFVRGELVTIGSNFQNANLQQILTSPKVSLILPLQHQRLPPAQTALLPLRTRSTPRHKPAIDSAPTTPSPKCSLGKLCTAS